MTNLFSAICDDYRIYVAYCKAKEIRLQKEENFYETEEWKDIEKIPASKLKKILEKD
ncbi:hypothetical protein K9L16_02165 [Candidatus Pacearchaeota archaeon]|nr:hypothetical protein [Candidatus Pacearchaeota archaeon]